MEMNYNNSNPFGIQLGSVSSVMPNPTNLGNGLGGVIDNTLSMNINPYFQALVDRYGSSLNISEKSFQMIDNSLPINSTSQEFSFDIEEPFIESSNSNLNNSSIESTFNYGAYSLKGTPEESLSYLTQQETQLKKNYLENKVTSSEESNSTFSVNNKLISDFTQKETIEPTTEQKVNIQANNYAIDIFDIKSPIGFVPEEIIQTNSYGISKIDMINYQLTSNTSQVKTLQTNTYGLDKQEYTINTTQTITERARVPNAQYIGFQLTNKYHNKNV